MNKLFLFIVFMLVGVFCFPQNILENPKALEKLVSKNNVWGERILLGKSRKEKPIFAYYYNRGGIENAMIVAGVHGSEFYGVDVANEVKRFLDGKKARKSKYRILLIPELFPDNVEKGRNHPFSINYGRKTCEICHGQAAQCAYCADPNRQMPCLDKPFAVGDTLSCFGEKIEFENQILLQTTQIFSPDRIVSLHCKNSSGLQEIGIYADPKTNSDKTSLGFGEDALLALEMAFKVKDSEGVIYGNFVTENYYVENDFLQRNKVFYLNPIYPQDPPAAFRNETQERSYETNGGKVTFGTWASTQIRDNAGKTVKKASTIITVELPQYYYFFGEMGNPSSLRTTQLQKNTNAYVKAITEVFLRE